MELGTLGDGNGSNKVVRLTVRLKDGRQFVRDAHTFKGMPAAPLTRAELRNKFMLQTTSIGAAHAGRLYEQLENLETQTRFSLA